MASYRLGVDVGGTHTDAVVMQGSTVLAAAKADTTANVLTGILTALRRAVSEAGIGRCTSFVADNNAARVQTCTSSGLSYRIETHTCTFRNVQRASCYAGHHAICEFSGAMQRACHGAGGAPVWSGN